MARNNYYDNESVSDEQFVPRYDSNIPSTPDSNAGGSIRPTEDPSRSTMDDNSGYPTTTSLDAAYMETEVNDSCDSIHSVKLVVGWLVCIKGAAIGQDFRLHAGWNYIGRDLSQDIALSDPKISRRMAKVSYDPESRSFGVAPAEGAKSLCYLNDKPLRGDRDFEAYDRLRIGDLELMLIPLCGEQFTWTFDQA